MKFGTLRLKQAWLCFLVVFGLATTACNPLAGMSTPNRHIVLEADAQELAKRSAYGISIDAMMNDSMAVIGKRASEISTTNPVIRRDGQNRIILEISADTNTDHLKNLLLSGGKLEIKLVDETVSPEEVATGKPRLGGEILPFSAGVGSGAPFIKVRRLGGLNGGSVKDAQPTFDTNSNEPAVFVQLNELASKKFAKLSAKNVGRTVAIIYDGKVIAAPIINEPILGGTVQIAGNFTVQSANELALILRSGQLDMKFDVIEDKAIK